MIIRVIVVDPNHNPREGGSDLRVFQVPENSAEFRLLTKLFDDTGLEWTTVSSPVASSIRRKT